MTDQQVGWLWVGGQVVVLGALILLPGGEAWTVPGWLGVIATVLFAGGIVVGLLAATRLGTALTPTPVPNERGALTTTGLYRFVRHPIYTGVLLIVAALAIRGESWPHLAVGIGCWAFFDRKAAWEERRLRERFPGYAAYAARTPKLVPGLRRGAD